MDVYRGVLRQQTGRGIFGNMMGLFSRGLVPILKKTASQQAKKLAPKLLKAGVGVLSDIANKKKTFKESARSRGRQLLTETIKRPAQKETIKRLGRKRKNQSRPRPGGVKKQRKDIFD